MALSTTSGRPAAPRPLPAAEGAEHRWLEVSGARLHVAEYGTGTPVLLLHGFPQHWFAWHRVAVLAAAGHRLICPDLRGFGWSEQTRRGYDIEGLSDDMLALMDALGLDRVGLVGHDWGAHVGFRLCLRAPERFSGYLALNMAHPWARHRAILPNLWRQWYTAFIEYPVIGKVVLRRWPAFIRFLLRHQVADRSVWQVGEVAEFTAAARVGAHAGQSMFWQYVVRDVPALLRGAWRGHRLTVPTVLLGGERDNVIPPSMLAGGEGHADDLTVRIVPGAGHFLPQEAPQAVAEAMKELFVTGC
ncbi:alpha/beta fold hydrolase [Streptomyces triticiradicis]|uniref:Alpha/beta hydrolase n=1 Tax=Streptomyces triticiradicis TaxID=2651189 RepID=A0A7J5DK35_9ACTN|nr:alpha/beta hydrolase [Streptomyces triticiradicis]KAB1989011.1 alpha/beta hydrolase [Streptomyces triticiradicis]